MEPSLAWPHVLPAGAGAVPDQPGPELLLTGPGPGVAGVQPVLPLEQHGRHLPGQAGARCAGAECPALGSSPEQAEL